MKFFTFKKAAIAHKAAWQKLRFVAGKGYHLVGLPPISGGPEPKNDAPFTRVVKALLPKRQIVMYDSITPGQIPANAQAVAGYVNGRWPTYSHLISSFPKAQRLSIAVSAGADADCLDVEQGDATIDQAAAWVKRQQARGVERPVVYTSVSQAGVLLRALARAGISRSQIRLWTAHYTFKPHRCGKGCGFGLFAQADATQYTDHALGRNLDASLVSPAFFE